MLDDREFDAAIVVDVHQAMRRQAIRNQRRMVREQEAHAHEVAVDACTMRAVFGCAKVMEKAVHAARISNIQRGTSDDETHGFDENTHALLHSVTQERWARPLTASPVGWRNAMTNTRLRQRDQRDGGPALLDRAGA
jgi:hypothetical protein